jgi:heterotetrameric sarcosine oxidase gamma subunit
VTLATISKLPIAPPLIDPLIGQNSPPSAQEQAARRVGIAQITIWNLLHIRGIGAEVLLSGAYSTPQMAIGAVESVSDGVLVRLRRDEFVLLTPDLKPTMDRLAAKPAERLITLTDITHGRGIICVVGARASNVLPKVCALDFADAKFPDLRAAQAILANVRALVIRMDTAQTSAYFLVIERSMTGYVWQVIYDAAQEWSGIVLSQDSLNLRGK